MCVSSPPFERLEQLTVFHWIMIKIIKYKGKFAPEQAMKAQKGSKCIALFFL
jgi:hypothetical protein